MKQTSLASIIINNYNYGRFLKAAIDSALNQTYPNLEVIVVDDGSTDSSSEVITSYGKQIIPIFKENEGQASACNAGFAASKGEVIIFLDADDMLLSTAVEKAVEALQEPNLVKVHWYQWQVDVAGNKTGKKHPPRILSEGDFREETIQKSIAPSILAPTSANAWKRKFIEAVCPLRERGDKHGADGYLCRLAPLFGRVKLIPEPQGCYRIHGENYRNSDRLSLSQKMQSDLQRDAFMHSILSEYIQQQGIYIEPEIWKKIGTNYDRTKNKLKLLQAVEQLIPEGEQFILVDEQLFKRELLNTHVFSKRVAIPIFEPEGQYLGPPGDDKTAIQELEKLHQAGANFIVFVWSAFWWLDYYHQFHEYLRKHYKCIKKNDQCVIFEC